MSYSVVQICNLSLNEIGEIPIVSLDDVDSVNARKCKLLYEPTKNRILSAYKWNFAMARASDTLAKTDIVNPFEYAYSYQLPVDCLRAWDIYGSDSLWVVEGDKLLCNDSSVNLRYIKRIENPNLFTAAFVECVVLDIASSLAISIGGDNGVAQERLLNRLRISILEAFAMGAVEGHPDAYNTVKNTTWQNAGR